VAKHGWLASRVISVVRHWFLFLDPVPVEVMGFEKWSLISDFMN